MELAWLLSGLAGVLSGLAGRTRLPRPTASLLRVLAARRLPTTLSARLLAASVRAGLLTAELSRRLTARLLVGLSPAALSLLVAGAAPARLLSPGFVRI